MLKLRYLLLIVTLSTLSPYLLLAMTPRSYEFLSVYNNTTSSDPDTMAVMYLYVLDKEFRNN